MTCSAASHQGAIKFKVTITIKVNTHPGHNHVLALSSPTLTVSVPVFSHLLFYATKLTVNESDTNLNYVTNTLRMCCKPDSTQLILSLTHPVHDQLHPEIY